MVSYKDGILKIRKRGKDEKSDLVRSLYEICLYLGIIFYFLMILYVHYTGVALLIAGAALITFDNLLNSRINKSVLSIWYLMFFAYAELSSIWAVYPSIAALRYSRFMLIILFTCFGMTQYASREKDIEKLLDVFIYAAFTILLIEFAGTPVSGWFSGYFGGNVSGNNTNHFGFIILFGSIFSFYKAYIKRKRIFYVLFALFMFGCVLSSSRKAIAMAVFGFLATLFFSFKRKHHFLHFFLALAASIAAFYMVMTVDLLYDIIGHRIEDLINFTNNQYSSQEIGSLQLRDTFIEFAKVLFKRKPLTGNGFANFAVLIDLETNEKGLYAHNNYWEILADLGMIGFIVYYWFYAYIAVTLCAKLVRKNFSYLNMISFIMLIAELILERGVVSMSMPYPQLIICLIYILSCDDKSEHQKKFYYANSNEGSD